MAIAFILNIKKYYCHILDFLQPGYVIIIGLEKTISIISSLELIMGFLRYPTHEKSPKI